MGNHYDPRDDDSEPVVNPLGWLKIEPGFKVLDGSLNSHLKEFEHHCEYEGAIFTREAPAKARIGDFEIYPLPQRVFYYLHVIHGDSCPDDGQALFKTQRFMANLLKAGWKARRP